MIRVRRVQQSLVLIVVGVLLVLLTLSASAQDDPNEPLPPPDEHMQDFAWFIGEWDIQSSMLMNAETNEWLDETLHSVHTYEMGGHIIFEHFFGPLGGEPFEAWSIRKYNPANGRWQQRWMDVGTGPILSWGGTFNDEGNYVGYAERYLDENFELAGEQAAREVFYDVTDDSFLWRYETTADGGATWTVSWTLAYTRSAGGM